MNDRHLVADDPFELINQHPRAADQHVKLLEALGMFLGEQGIANIGDKEHLQSRKRFQPLQDRAKQRRVIKKAEVDQD
ncbi:MAG: hypothetical protein HC834_01160, partial [Rhodospirillales bacterium]|nr:hypothetical protein [Rhodospirillales bacterium]